MSLFRKPKKIQRRALTSTLDDEEDAVKNDNQLEKMQDDAMDLEVQAPPPPQISSKVKKKKNHKEMKVKPSSSKDNSTTKSLLSFADEEEDGEVFQVRKSSHSKKVMRMLDKERRRKKKEERDTSTSIMAVDGYAEQSYHNRDTRENGSRLSITHSLGSTTTSIGGSTEHRKSNKDKIQTEIRTDDFVVSWWLKSLNRILFLMDVLLCVLAAMICPMTMNMTVMLMNGITLINTASINRII
ncbi:uncharacterized protein LOC119638503 isoform X2 [Glossina fuscipes]|uniref:Uncharacterized protein LOC119638503 isoform X2 n=1 Tax=Glossina fuscipes TaxID=7396 RepID=A0A9C5Z7C6_9MUSC|nr:uncharacterized protein LOC119638503 isoform X2 [Glossina fuscipes]